MYKIEEYTNKITLTKGDNADINISVYNNNDIKREYGDDTLTLTVKNKDGLGFSVVAVDNIFHIEPKHTKSLPSGKYYYDVQLDTFTGKVYTIIPKSKFVIEEESTE